MSEGIEKGVAAVVGTFDGVHRGHIFLIEHLKRIATERGLTARVYTFSSHPLEQIAPAKAPARLLDIGEKTARLKQAGADEVIVEDFSSLRPLTAGQYIRKIAARGVKVLLVGFDNRFGSDHLVTVDQFVRAADGSGVEIIQAPELRTPDGTKISSSAIRDAVSSGNLSLANQLSGYPYHLDGIVEHGKQLGRTIGFPTANLVPTDSRALIPQPGVYAGMVKTRYGEFPAMTNVGRRPTVDCPEAPVTIETHIIGLDSDLYGESLTLFFLERIRSEQRFASVDNLRDRLVIDRELAMQVYNKTRVTDVL